MKLRVYKKINDTTTLFKSDEKGGVNFVLVERGEKILNKYYYDVTIYWIDSMFKRHFIQAEHKEDFLGNPYRLEAALSDNVYGFPCNADLGWKDGEITEEDKKLLDIK